MRLVHLGMVLVLAACDSGLKRAESQAAAEQPADTVRIVLHWGPLDPATAEVAPAREIRWNLNGRMIRHVTVSSFSDTLVVTRSPGPGVDTVVVALWDLAGGPPLFRQMEVIDGAKLAAMGPEPELVIDRRREAGSTPAAEEPVAAEPRTEPGTAEPSDPRQSNPLPPPAPPPTDADLVLNFDDPARLGVTCGGARCPFPRRSYRKHDFVPQGGVDGSGAIRMSWHTGMSIGFSPIWIDGPLVPHFKLRYAVRQSAPMRHQGSAIKLLRLFSQANSPSHHRIGTLESKRGQFVWYWDSWLEGAPVGAVPLNTAVPADNQWHLYEVEVDYRDVSRLSVTFWLDGVKRKTVRRSATRDLIASGSTLVVSPAAEMYSCGPQGCNASINSGEYVVDDFSLTTLP